MYHSLPLKILDLDILYIVIFNNKNCHNPSEIRCSIFEILYSFEIRSKLSICTFNLITYLDLFSISQILCDLKGFYIFYRTNKLILFICIVIYFEDLQRS